VFTVVEPDQDTCSGIFHLGNGPEIDDIEMGRFDGNLLYEVYDIDNEDAPLALGAPVLVTALHHDTQAVELRINQMLVAEPTMPLPALIERMQNVIGRSEYADCGTLQGKLSELIIYGRAVSDEELLTIESYLQREWSCCE
jgi:hypothetical protein